MVEDPGPSFSLGPEEEEEQQQKQQGEEQEEVEKWARATARGNKKERNMERKNRQHSVKKWAVVSIFSLGSQSQWLIAINVGAIYPFFEQQQFLL